MKEINLSFNVNILLNQTDIHFIEEEMLKMREDIFLNVLEKTLLQIEIEATGKDSKCQKCGYPLVKNGSDKRKIKTLLGEIEIKRSRMYCKKCRANTYPFDDAIGLASFRHETLGVRKKSLWAAAKVSYEKSSAFLEKFAGFKVGHNKIHQMAIEEGKQIESFEEARRAKVFDAGKFSGSTNNKAP